MRFIIAGRDGQLGRSLTRRLAQHDEHEVVAALGRADLDLSDARGPEAWFASAPEADVFVNAAAYTAVDRCETEIDLATQVNGEAPGELARLCQSRGILFVHVSTDFVFDGRAEVPYREDGIVAPASAYGRTKRLGEERVLAATDSALVVRTSWVFGPGKNFVGAILRQALLRRSGEVEGPLSVVDDQRGCPTYAPDLAEAIIGLVEEKASGIVHFSNSEPTTWWGFARAILDECGYQDLDIDKTRSADLALPAPRPAFSVLDTSRAASLGVTGRPWVLALREYLHSSDAPEGSA